MSNVSLATRFEDYLRRDDFPCVGAKAALSQGAIEVIEAPDISSPVSDLDIYKALSEFGDHLDLTAPVVQSFAIVFSGPDSISEEQFETFMWNRLQSLHNIDAAAGETWRSDVDADPESAHFSLCLAGRPYFVVGLHPSASRPARRAQGAHECASLEPPPWAPFSPFPPGDPGIRDPGSGIRGPGSMNA